MGAGTGVRDQCGVGATGGVFMPVLPRTAVVIVHGIGEQGPLGTLLSFVGRGAPDDADGGVLEREDRGHRFVNPDRISPRTFSRIVRARGGSHHSRTCCVKNQRCSIRDFSNHNSWKYRFMSTGKFSPRAYAPDPTARRPHAVPVAAIRSPDSKLGVSMPETGCDAGLRLVWHSFTGAGRSASTAERPKQQERRPFSGGVLRS